MGFDIEDMVIKPFQQGYFVWLVVDDELALELGFRTVLEVVNVCGDDVAVCDQIALSVDHIRDHHDLVDRRVGKLQGQFGSLDIKGQYNAIGSLNQIFAFGEGRFVIGGLDVDLTKNVVAEPLGSAVTVFACRSMLM